MRLLQEPSYQLRLLSTNHAFSNIDNMITGPLRQWACCRGQLRLFTLRESLASREIHEGKVGWPEVSVLRYSS